MAKKDPRQRNLIILLIIIVSFALFDFLMNMDDYLSFYGNSKKSTTTKKVEKKIENKKSEKLIVLPSTQEWGRDPFYDASLRIKKKIYVKKIETVKLILKAISFSENMSVAMINSQILAVGDKISGYNVKKIDPKQVLLEKEGQTKILRLK